jgi:hypothetical protein
VRQFAKKGVIQQIHRHRLQHLRPVAGRFGAFDGTHHRKPGEIAGRDKSGKRLASCFRVAVLRVAYHPLDGGAQGIELMLIHFPVQRIGVKDVVLPIEQERPLIAEVIVERESQILVQPGAIILLHARGDFLVRLDQAHGALHEGGMIVQRRADDLPLECAGAGIIAGGRKSQDRAKARYNDQHRSDGRHREAARCGARPSRNISLPTEGHEKVARSTQCRRRPFSYARAAGASAPKGAPPLRYPQTTGRPGREMRKIPRCLLPS